MAKYAIRVNGNTVPPPEKYDREFFWRSPFAEPDRKKRTAKTKPRTRGKAEYCSLR